MRRTSVTLGLALMLAPVLGGVATKTSHVLRPPSEVTYLVPPAGDECPENLTPTECATDLLPPRQAKANR